MKHILSKQLFERKQVGVIYHYTSVMSAARILDSGYMTSREFEICFTRNKNLHKYHPEITSTDVRLVIDGDRLSDFYHIQPHDANYTRPNGKVVKSHNFADEYEERITLDRVDVLRSVIGVDIIYPKVNGDELIYLLKKADGKGIPVNLDAVKREMEAEDGV